MMDKLEITKDLIRSLVVYGNVIDWSVNRVSEECERLGISRDLSDATLNDD